MGKFAKTKIMDTQYQPLYKQAASMQYKFHDYTHAAGTAVDPGAMALRNQMHALTNDLARGRDPRQIDNRMRTIQGQLRRQQTLTNNYATGHTQVLNDTQTRFMNRNFDSMRRTMTQHPNFK